MNSFYKLVSENDFPNENASTSEVRDSEHENYHNLEGQEMAENIRRRWEMNYQEASIFLEEGANNEKFNSHPKSQDSLPSYLIVHNQWFYWLDFLASFMLLSLAAFESPAVDLFALPIWAHGSLELLGLFVVGTELFMKLKWQGWRTFVAHTRTMIKAGTLVIMIFEAVVVLIRQSNHLRVTRAIRPIFLIDNHFCGGVRRFIRQILQSLPPIIDMLGLLMFFMLIFSVIGFYFFSWDPKNPYFTTLSDSFVNLFVLLTTANFPDIMMPTYSRCKWSVIFFAMYLAIVLYFFMNLMLAVVYDAFTANEKDKFRKLMLHKRKACHYAFRLLVNKKSPEKLSFCHFEGLMKHFASKKSHRDIYLIFKALNKSGDGSLTVDEFCGLYDAVAIRWNVIEVDQPWFHNCNAGCNAAFKWVYKLVTWKWFDVFIYAIILINGIWLLVETANISNNRSSYGIHISSSWQHLMFVSIYAVEAILKVVGLGTTRYFASGWNVFDLLVLLLSAAGLIVEYFGTPFFYVLILRTLRLLSLFQMKRRYRDVFETLFILLPRMMSASIVLLILYYFFAVIGMEMFAGYDMRNCCQDSFIEDYYKYNSTSKFEGYYYLNNFDDMLKAGVTLFELTVINNWFVIMEGYASVTSPWSRIYFMIFYIVTMVVMTIIVAFILEAFLFRIQYQRCGNIDDEKDFEVDVVLSKDELHFCYNRVQSSRDLAMYTRDLNLPDQVIYKGQRPRNKHTLSLKMYKEEVEEWLKSAQAEEEDFRRRSGGVPTEWGSASINSAEEGEGVLHHWSQSLAV